MSVLSGREIQPTASEPDLPSSGRGGALAPVGYSNLGRSPAVGRHTWVDLGGPSENTAL